MLRGGWGRYYFHIGNFGGPQDLGEAVFSVNLYPSTFGHQLFAKDLDTMAEWEAARHLPSSRPADQPVNPKEVTPTDPGRVAPAA